jgi:putative transposase
MHGCRGHCRSGRKKKRVWRLRFRQHISGHGGHVGLSGYSANWQSTESGWEFAVSSVSVRNSGYVVQSKKFKVTTDSKHTLPVAENLLNQQFEASRPNTVWVSDITYIPTNEGWLYLAGHKDIFTGEIVGYAMGKRITKTLVSQSLFRAVAGKHPAKGLLHHSDRGSQYCAHEYRKILDQFGMKASMSRKGNCFDNAPMESFWGTLKQELVHHRRYRSRQEAIQDITEYIEIFYNRQRRQARLGFLSPSVYEQKFYAGQLAA